MDDRSAQTFGCFLGVLLAVIFSLPLYTFVELPLWLEYVITGVFVIVFGTAGNAIVRAVAKPRASGAGLQKQSPDVTSSGESSSQKAQEIQEPKPPSNPTNVT